MSLNYHVIGLRIRNYRRQRNLSQNDVAEQINKSSAYISYLESGIKHPSLETLTDLANLLGVTADMLLGENLRHTRLVNEVEFQQILNDCTDEEKRFLVEATAALKDILKYFDVGEVTIEPAQDAE